MINKRIYLLDFVLKELRKWKMLLIVAILGGVIFAYIGYIRAVNNYNNLIADSENQNVDLDTKINVLMSNMSENDINVATEYYRKIKSYYNEQKYLDNSILMNLDAANIHQINYVITVSCISDEDVKSRELDIREHVASILMSDRFFDVIRINLYPDSENQYIKELLSLNKNLMYVTDNADVISLNVIIPDGIDVQMINSVVSDFIDDLGNDFTDYDIDLVGSNESYTAETSIINQQINTFTLIDNFKLKLDTDKGKLTSDESQLADLLIRKDEESKNSIDDEDITVVEEIVKPGISKKYILIGFVFGIILIIGIDFIGLILTNKVSTIQDVNSFLSIKPLLAFYKKGDMKGLLNSRKIYKSQYNQYLDVDIQMNNFIRKIESDTNSKELAIVMVEKPDEKDKEIIDNIISVVKKKEIMVSEIIIHFIGNIDTGNQLNGDTPVVLYVRQDRTALDDLTRLKEMVEQNKRKLIGFIYADC